MKLYQVILAIPDDCDSEDIELVAKCSKGSVSVFGEGPIELSKYYIVDSNVEESTASANSAKEGEVI